MKNYLEDSNKKTLTVILLLIIATLAFLIYFNALFNGFVYDDTVQILNNPWIRDMKYLQNIFTHNSWEFKPEAPPSNYYRPLLHVINMINYYAFGFRPWGYHFVNVLFHIATSVLVFFISLEVFKKKQNTPLESSSGFKEGLLSAPFIVALLFATHPIHTEAVTWLGGICDVSYTFFYLLSFLLYIRSMGNVKMFKYNYLLSLVSFFLATLCKEPALTLPIILIAYDYGLRKKPIFTIDTFRRISPYLLVAICYLLLRINVLGAFSPLRTHQNLGTYLVVINVFPLFSDYVKSLLIPINLNLMHTFYPLTSLFSEKGVISLVALAVFLCVIYLSFTRNRMVFFCLLLLVIPLLPAFYITGIEGGRPFSERYLYLPCFGFVLLVAYLLKWLQGNMLKITVSFISISLILVGLYSFGTIERNMTWKDDYTLFLDVVKKSPSDDIAHIELGEASMDRGSIDEAIDHYQTAIMLNPSNVLAYANLGSAFARKGLMDKAIFYYKFALELSPKIFSARKGLAYIYYNMGLYEQSMKEYQDALTINPNDADSYYQLGNIFFQINKVADAIEQYNRSLMIEPNNANAYVNLGTAYAKIGRFDDARECFQYALRLNPSDVVASSKLMKLQTEMKNNLQ